MQSFGQKKFLGPQIPHSNPKITYKSYSLWLCGSSYNLCGNDAEVSPYRSCKYMACIEDLRVSDSGCRWIIRRIPLCGLLFQQTVQRFFLLALEGACTRSPAIKLPTGMVETICARLSGIFRPRRSDKVSKGRVSGT